jgi:hypothetical protein
VSQFRYNRPNNATKLFADGLTTSPADFIAWFLANNLDASNASDMPQKPLSEMESLN